MIALPAITPVIIPVLPAIATEVLLLPHEPPAVPSLNMVVLLTQTVGIPVIPAGVDGNGFTVKVAVAEALPQLLMIV